MGLFFDFVWLVEKQFFLQKIVHDFSANQIWFQGVNTFSRFNLQLLIFILIFAHL